ncbi:MAG: glycosyltransferase family 4 protein [Proteobacteria bacterium]|nr:glycosyltransferase family 4 protein [Pseudomonadota bacterium]
MRILTISQFFPPDITAAAFRVGDTVRLLSERGFEVKVLTTHPYKARAVDDTGIPEFPGVDVFRSRVVYPQPKGGKQYIAHYLSFVLGSISQGVGLLSSGWRPDVVWASSPPLFVGISARVLSMVTRCPFLLGVRDIWPDSAVAADQISANGPLYYVGKLLEQYLYDHADEILCVSKPMKEYLSQCTDVPIGVAYNGVLSDLSLPSSSPLENDAREDLERTKTIIYAGNIGHAQQLYLLVKAFAELLFSGDLEGWRLRIIGDGAQSMNLRELIIDLNAKESVSIEKSVTREKIAKELSNADLLYLNLKNHPIFSKTIPSKIFDFMLSGRPILAGISGEGAEILNQSGANIAIEPGNLLLLKNALLEMTSNISKYSALSHMNRKIVLSNYTRENALDVFIESFNRLKLKNKQSFSRSTASF